MDKVLPCACAAMAQGDIDMDPVLFERGLLHGQAAAVGEGNDRRAQRLVDLARLDLCRLAKAIVGPAYRKLRSAGRHRLGIACGKLRLQRGNADRARLRRTEQHRTPAGESPDQRLRDCGRRQIRHDRLAEIQVLLRAGEQHVSVDRVDQTVGQAFVVARCRTFSRALQL